MQGQLHAAGLARRQPGIAGGEDDAGGDGDGRPQPVEQRLGKSGAAGPGQGQRPQRQHEGADHGQQGHRAGVRPRQAGGGQGHRGHQQQGEGIGHPAGEEQQRGQLQHVEAQVHGRFRIGRQAAAAADQGGAQIDRDADGDQQAAEQERRAHAEHQAAGQQHRRLARRADPAQGGDGVEPDATAGRIDGALALQGHVGGATCGGVGGDRRG